MACVFSVKRAGLKGPESVAQGNALGIATPSDQALKGRDGVGAAVFMSPFQGSIRF